MFSCVDLHAHSTASDGSLSPEDLVERACDHGVTTFALTDHDTTDGVTRAQEAASARSLNFIPGIEVSVTWSNQTIHVLGLNIAIDSPSLQKGLTAIREFRSWRAMEIARRLENKGIPGAYEGVLGIAGDKLISRTHFARFLVQEGYAESVQKVFKKYLVSNKPGYVPGHWAALEDAVAWIREANGVPVIAHPMRYKMTRTKLQLLVKHFKEAGGQGLEVAYARSHPDEISKITSLTKKYDLHASRGSDFHGPDIGYNELGCAPELPRECKPVWELF